MPFRKILQKIYASLSEKFFKKIHVSSLEKGHVFGYLCSSEKILPSFQFLCPSEIFLQIIILESLYSFRKIHRKIHVYWSFRPFLKNASSRGLFVLPKNSLKNPSLGLLKIVGFLCPSEKFFRSVSIVLRNNSLKIQYLRLLHHSEKLFKDSMV